MDRREFLKLVAPSVLAGWRGRLGLARAQAWPDDADWNALARSLAGELLLPQSRAYEAARKLYNPRFRPDSPCGNWSTLAAWDHCHSSISWVMLRAGWALNVKDVATPKLPPPPPRHAQKRFGSRSVSQVRDFPSAVTN